MSSTDGRRERIAKIVDKGYGEWMDADPDDRVDPDELALEVADLILAALDEGTEVSGYSVTATRNGEVRNLDFVDMEALLALVTRAVGNGTIYTVVPLGAQSPGPSGWMPIETAPKDGTKIALLGTLASNPGFGIRACVSRWCEHDEAPYHLRGGGWPWSSPGLSDRFLPTHWQPLPPPPGDEA